MKKQMLLKAELHNWSLIGPGAWTTVTWIIFYDGSYKIEREFNPEWEDMFAGSREKNRFEEYGRLDKKGLNKLKRQIDKDPWRNPKIQCHACDGVAWIIEAFSEYGDIMKTSGELDYIYGQKVLEGIVKCLPNDGIPISAPAYINVKDDEETMVDHIVL